MDQVSEVYDDDFDYTFKSESQPDSSESKKASSFNKTSKLEKSNKI